MNDMTQPTRIPIEQLEMLELVALINTNSSPYEKLYSTEEVMEEFEKRSEALKNKATEKQERELIIEVINGTDEQHLDIEVITQRTSMGEDKLRKYLVPLSKEGLIPAEKAFTLSTQEMQVQLFMVIKRSNEILMAEITDLKSAVEKGNDEIKKLSELISSKTIQDTERLELNEKIASLENEIKENETKLEKLEELEKMQSEFSSLEKSKNLEIEALETKILELEAKKEVSSEDLDLINSLKNEKEELERNFTTKMEEFQKNQEIATSSLSSKDREIEQLKNALNKAEEEKQEILVKYKELEEKFEEEEEETEEEEEESEEVIKEVKSNKPRVNLSSASENLNQNDKTKKNNRLALIIGISLVLIVVGVFTAMYISISQSENNPPVLGKNTTIEKTKPSVDADFASAEDKIKQNKNTPVQVQNNPSVQKVESHSNAAISFEQTNTINKEANFTKVESTNSSNDNFMPLPEDNTQKKANTQPIVTNTLQLENQQSNPASREILKDVNEKPSMTEDQIIKIVDKFELNKNGFMFNSENYAVGNDFFGNKIIYINSISKKIFFLNNKSKQTFTIVKK